MYQGGLAIIPTLDYYYIKPDGTCHSPLQKTGYHSYCDMDPYEFIEIAGDIGFIGTPIYHSNLLSDTAYLLRVLDNHIYKASADSVQCLANMTFIPEVPEKTKLNFDYEAEEKYFGRSIPNYMYDMKDYLYMWYYHGGEYLFEKTTSKVYHISHDSLHVSLPEISSIAIFDNTIIGCVSDYALNDALERMESKDYDHRYSPDVEAFYRKARRCENPPIIIAHYKSKK